MRRGGSWPTTPWGSRGAAVKPKKSSRDGPYHLASHDVAIILALRYNGLIRGVIHSSMKQMSITSIVNWEKYVETGDNSLLGDIDIAMAPEGTEAVLAVEGLERRVILGKR